MRVIMLYKHTARTMQRWNELKDNHQLKMCKTIFVDFSSADGRSSSVQTLIYYYDQCFVVFFESKLRVRVCFSRRKEVLKNMFSH